MVGRRRGQRPRAIPNSPLSLKDVVVEREGQRLTLQLETGEDPRLKHGDPQWALSWVEVPTIPAAVDWSGVDPATATAMATDPIPSRPSADHVKKVRERLARAIPRPQCEIDFDEPWHLLIGTILSAQSTDRTVNTVTPLLFEKWPTPEALATAPRKS